MSEFVTMRITGTITLPRLVSNLGMSNIIVRKHIKSGIRDAINKVKFKVFPYTPYKTGQLLNSWRTEFVTLSGKLQNVAPYAGYVETMKKRSGHINLTTPGTRIPFLEPAAKESLRSIEKIFEKEGDRIIKEFIS